MPKKKKLGYNWRARQHKRSGFRHNQQSVWGSDLPMVELGSSATEYVVGTRVNDSNVLVLPSKRKVADSSEFERAPKRKKLSGKQRKRLQKVVEAKEKRARVSILIKKHYTWVGHLSPCPVGLPVNKVLPAAMQIVNKAYLFQ